jgi:hypothetical protein
MKIRADRRVGILLGGVLLATLVALGATVVLPATDPSLDVKDVNLTEQEVKGMEIVRREGLWQCEAHGRETWADGEGAAKPEDVAGLNPVMLGLEVDGRGDDYCGVKLSDDDADAVAAFFATRVAF